MHRTIEAVVPSESTEPICLELKNNQFVIGITILPQASIKPKGDVFQIHVLNKGADQVLKIIQDNTPGERFSVVTSEVASINSPSSQSLINRDYDEAIWEEMETGLRHNGRLTQNYCILMAIGGIIASIGFFSDTQNQTIAFIAASIIAPALESIAKLSLGIGLGKRDPIVAGLKAIIVGYLIAMVASGLIFLLFLHTGNISKGQFLNNSFIQKLLSIHLNDLVLSVAASAASITMYLAYRRNVIAGPLIALIIIPAIAAIGMCIAIGEWNYAAMILKRLGTDLFLLISIAILLIWLKQLIVHKRKPIR